jgi:hypothetical protein
MAPIAPMEQRLPIRGSQNEPCLSSYPKLRDSTWLSPGGSRSPPENCPRSDGLSFMTNQAMAHAASTTSPIANGAARKPKRQRRSAANDLMRNWAGKNVAEHIEKREPIYHQCAHAASEAMRCNPPFASYVYNLTSGVRIAVMFPARSNQKNR